MIKELVAAGAIVVVAGACAPALAQAREQSVERLDPVGQSPEERDAEAARLRGQLVVMESALVQAVRSAANRLILDLSRATQAEPSSILMGAPQASGFRLPPYGVVFTVRVPGMSGVLLYALPFVMEQQRRQLGTLAGGKSLRPPIVAPVPSEDGFDSLLVDPDAAYVSAIKAALIEAMLENSTALRIPLDENLTVIARQDAKPNPFDPTDGVRTMRFTVKGSDLDAFHRKQIALEEARRLVVVSVD